MADHEWMDEWLVPGLAVVKEPTDPSRTSTKMPLVVPHELLAACASGDRQALGKLFELCRHRVYSIALHCCGDESTALDVSQDVFLKLLSKLGQFRREAEFSTWLYRVVVNASVDSRRRARRFHPLPDGLLNRVSGPKQESDYERHQLQVRVRTALGRLGHKLRLPLVLRYLEGLSYEEIGAVLSISPGTVASRLSRAHIRLAEMLRDLAPAVE